MIERFTDNSEWLDKLINDLEKKDEYKSPELAASLEEGDEESRGEEGSSARKEEATVTQPTYIPGSRARRGDGREGTRES